MRAPTLPALLALALVAPSASAGVVVVDAQGGGAFTNLQSAATAAAAGDILLVRSGVYDALQLNAKPLVVVADAGATVSVTNGVRISGLTSQQTVVLSGIEVRGGTALHALQVTNCQGPVRVDTCVLLGAAGIVLPGPSDFCTQCLPDDQLNLEGGDGARVANSADVSFAVCTLRGGTGQSMRPCSRRGGNGLDSTASFVSAYDSTFQGGDSGVDNGQILGLDCIYDAARGATGARVSYLQTSSRDAQGRVVLGTPRVFVLLDAVY